MNERMMEVVLVDGEDVLLGFKVRRGELDLQLVASGT